MVDGLKAVIDHNKPNWKNFKRAQWVPNEKLDKKHPVTVSYPRSNGNGRKFGSYTGAETQKKQQNVLVGGGVEQKDIRTFIAGGVWLRGLLGQLP